MKLPLDLEAAVHHEGWAQNWEPVSGHMELAALVGRRKDREEKAEMEKMEGEEGRGWANLASST